MRPLNRRLLLRVLLVFSVLTVAALVWSNRGTEDETRSIRRLLDRQVADWNRGDLDAYLAAYWQSPDLVFQSGADRSDGWDTLRDRYRRRYHSEGRQMGTLAFEGIEVVILGRSSALARGRWKLVAADGQAHGGLFTLILRKQPEGWRIIHDHTSGA